MKVKQQDAGDPAEIWLQAKPYSCDGRLWSEDPHEGEDGTKYIRADLAHATLALADAGAVTEVLDEEEAYLTMHLRNADDKDGPGFMTGDIEGSLQRIREALARQEPTQ